MSEELTNGESSTAVDLTYLEIEQLLGIFVGILAGKAWQYMGLRLAPNKNEVEKDLVKAASAIDCASYLSDKLSHYLPLEEDERVKAMIIDLKINYAKII
jgi:hypothetical protein